MARRLINPSFFRDGAICRLQPTERLFFIFLWCDADDQGRGLVRFDDWPQEFFPRDHVEAASLFEALEREGRIFSYQVEGRHVFCIPKFTDHQTLRSPRPSKYPPCVKVRETVCRRVKLCEIECSGVNISEVAVHNLRERNLSKLNTTKPKNPLSPPRGNSHEKVTPEFIEGLVTEYSAVFGGDQNVRDLITDAMNHKARTKALSEQTYLERWLQRDAKKLKAGVKKLQTLEDWL